MRASRTARLAVMALLAMSTLGARPADVHESLDKAGGLLRDGRAGQAAELYAGLLASDPGDREAQAGRVRALLAQDLWRDALEEARGFTARTADPGVRASLGEALFRAGRLAEAESVLESIAREGTGRPAGVPSRALLALGRLRIAQGREEEGAALLDRALDAAPDDRDVVFAAAEVAPHRTRRIELLERYLALASGRDDPMRIEGARGSIRLDRALGDRRVWVATQRPARLEIPLRQVLDDTGRLLGHVLEADLGGRKPVRLLLDSGSTGLFLVERIARRHGFEPLADQAVFGAGARGRTPAARGLLPVLRLSGLHFSDALVTVSGDELEPQGRWQGVLGLSAFQGYRIALDLARRRVVLDLDAPALDGPSYWTVSGQWLVEASSTSGVPGLFLLDTGASVTVVSLGWTAVVPGAVLGPPVGLRGYGGSLAGARMVRGVGLTLGGRQTRGGALAATDLSVRSRLGGVEVSGFVGLDLLADRRILLDTRHRRFMVE